MKILFGTLPFIFSLACSSSPRTIASLPLAQESAIEEKTPELLASHLDPFQNGFVDFDNVPTASTKRDPAQESNGLKQCQDFWKAQSGSVWSITQTLETEPGNTSLFICNGSIRAGFPASSNQSCISLKPYVNVSAGQKVRIIPRKWALVGFQPKREFGFIFQDIESAYQKKCVLRKSKDPQCSVWERELGDKNKTAQSSVVSSSGERFMAAWPMIARKRPFFHCSAQTLQKGLGTFGGAEKFKLREPARASVPDSLDFTSPSERDATIINY